jgi:acyl-CoA carboxylase subunit beta
MSRAQNDGLGLSGIAFETEWDTELTSSDPLDFPGYRPGAPEARGGALVTGLARIAGRPVALARSRFACYGGSMGAVEGERLVRLLDRAGHEGLPVVASVTSGGVRLQEGMIGLVQMARTTEAVLRFRESGRPFVAVLNSPTTGGVYASWVSLADLRISSAGAVIGFAGPRVVEVMTGSAPPCDSHRAEGALRSGAIDAIVESDRQLVWLAAVLGFGRVPPVLPAGRPRIAGPAVGAGESDSDWDRVLSARSPAQPSGLEWASALCSSWVALATADHTITAAVATVGNRRVVVIAMDRHANGDAAARPGPAGYRLAQRAFELASRWRLPVLTIIDTPGAAPDAEAEATGVAAEISRTLAAAAQHPLPTVALCIGEGGSGGAMALAYADQRIMLADAVFCVIAPEAAGVILEGSAESGPRLAGELKVSAAALAELGVVDRVVEPEVAAVRAAVESGLDEAVAGQRSRWADDLTSAAVIDASGAGPSAVAHLRGSGEPDRRAGIA